MPKFIYPDREAVEQCESILIHAYYYLLNYDYRRGLFSDESSIYDMGGTGLTDDDYRSLAEAYYAEGGDKLDYTSGERLYNRMHNSLFDQKLFERFESAYGFKLDPKIYLLKDIALLLDQHFPDRDWDTENVFIIKKMDAEREREEKAEAETRAQSKVQRLPVRKKPTREDILNGYNEYLMQSVLGMSYEEADALAKLNWEKRIAGKSFKPYNPDTYVPTYF